MHVAVYCSPFSYSVEFDGETLSWLRPKTGRPCSIKISNTGVSSRDIRIWLGLVDRHSRQHYYRILRKMGKRAKMQCVVSPNTLRHTYAYNRLVATHWNFSKVAAEMGCSLKTLYDNYATLQED